MTIPANALIYGTFVNIWPTSFAIFDTVSTMFVVDVTYSQSSVDGIATGCVEGTIGSPWATMVVHEACDPTVCSGSIQSLNVNGISGEPCMAVA